MKSMLMVPFLLLSLPLSAQDVRVLEVRGAAEMRSGVDQAWAPLKAGDEIPEGAWIQTALKSLVYIKFWTNTVVQIKSASLVQVKGLSNDGKRMTGRIHLALGSVRVRVHPERTEDVDFKIVAPKMTTSIKGTDCEVSNLHVGPENVTRDGFTNSTQNGFPSSQVGKASGPFHVGKFSGFIWKGNGERSGGSTGENLRSNQKSKFMVNKMNTENYKNNDKPKFTQNTTAINGIGPVVTNSPSTSSNTSVSVATAGNLPPQQVGNLTLPVTTTSIPGAP